MGTRPIFSMELPIKARGQGRPRAAPSGHVYKASADKEYEDTIRAAAQEAWGVDKEPVDYAVEIYVRATYERPKSITNPREFHVRKPDVDNILKSACDAITGVVYKDDALVYQCRGRKQWGEVDALKIYVWKAIEQESRPNRYNARKKARDAEMAKGKEGKTNDKADV